MDLIPTKLAQLHGAGQNLFPMTRLLILLDDSPSQVRKTIRVFDKGNLRP